ncbi:MAG: hypothetical protein APR54_08890 [Candidatus Cloacimonas sp. SDB]|nr:MAG: hypothetical protein APR54_08890 [Candidatus Cloacimonas sp. SDB]
MKKMIYPTLIFVIGLLLVSCMAGEIVSTNYYILEYMDHTEQEELFRKEPFDVTVLIHQTKVPQTYNRRQLVIRHFGPRITYANSDIWGVKLSEIIPSLLNKRLNNYNIFKHSEEDYFEDPDYEITTTLNNLALYKSDQFNQTRFNIKFSLVETGKERSILEHSINVEKSLPDDEVDTYVQTVNEIFLYESDEFIKKMINYFSGEPLFEEYVAEAEGLSDSSLEDTGDEDLSATGKGLLLLPAITRTDNEPYYTIIDKYGYEISGRMGVSVPLVAGDYNIRYGSGNEDQMMVKKGVTIVPRYKKIVEPDWGCLIVEVTDTDRNFVKVRYEVFDAASGESFGSDFPSEEEIGEQQKVWVLKPGLYKVTINNAPFNTYYDFTTVLVEKGISQRLTIVVETDEEGNALGMVGAGVLEEYSLSSAQDKVKLSSAIHTNVNVNSDNEADKEDSKTTIILNAQLDNRLTYDEGPFHYSLKNLIEMGTTKTSDTDFRISSDDFELKNTAIYYFLKNLGFYGRFDMNSHFFPENSYSSEKFLYSKYNKDNQLEEADKLADEVEIQPSFFPIILKEGIGINYRFLNYSRANMSVRTGFGLRQDINKGVYELSGSFIDSSGVENRTYQEQQTENTTGLEVSLIGNFQLPFNLSYTTNADMLFPFDKKNLNAFEWENTISLKLFKYISIDYKLKLENKRPELGDEYIVEKHSLFLRITYILR